MMTMTGIVRAVCAVTGYPKQHVTGKARDRHLIEARRAICVLGREAGYSYSRIAIAIGRRDHTTVTHHCRLAKERPDLAATIIVAARDRLKQMEAA